MQTKEKTLTEIVNVFLERARRIELPYSAWEADVLPLNYARTNSIKYYSMVSPKRKEKNEQKKLMGGIEPPTY